MTICPAAASPAHARPACSTSGSRFVHPAAFTLVELLIVVAIIGLLISFLLPGLNSVRSQARSINCQANERQLYLACISFANDHKNLLPCPGSIGSDPPSDPDVAKATVFPMDRVGVANFSVGVIWKYIGGVPTRQTVVWCPADNAELSVVQGTRANIDRNFSYSMNSTLYTNVGSSPRQSMYTYQIAQPQLTIMWWEEVAPNDSRCVTPSTNNDDRPTGRHGRITSLQYGTDDYNNAGRGNYCFFDGHVESISPAEINNTPSYYGPLK